MTWDEKMIPQDYQLHMSQLHGTKIQIPNVNRKETLLKHVMKQVLWTQLSVIQPYHSVEASNFDQLLIFGP